MTTLNNLIRKLQELADKGNGELPVFFVSGSSGASESLDYASIGSVTGREEAGPFLDVGAKFVSVSGH